MEFPPNYGQVVKNFYISLTGVHGYRGGGFYWGQHTPKYLLKLVLQQKLMCADPITTWLHVYMTEP